ncbi:Hypothetical protein FKW44_009105, partial [Caligus rogercresseyi]
MCHSGLPKKTKIIHLRSLDAAMEYTIKLSLDHYTSFVQIQDSYEPACMDQHYLKSLMGHCSKL